jgi:L-threonylcarbamoyladenylate synthase
MTEVLKVNPVNPERDIIEQAAKVIRDGGLVAFPTETVYGLGANALDEKATLKIFSAKNRPPDNPLIVHIAREDDLHLLASEVPNKAEELAREFWPGPLTLVLPRSELLPDPPVAGLSTVAIRMPSHPVARALIDAAEVPIAAPSANLAGKPSPTSADHVLRDLEGRIDVILDGGEIVFGVESTVIDLTTSPPTLLRPGPVTVEELQERLGEVRVHPAASGEATAEEVIARSPGMKYKHYAPRTELLVVEGAPELLKEEIQRLVKEQKLAGKRVGVVVVEESVGDYGADFMEVLGSRRKPRTIARNLFKVLRELDLKHLDLAIVEGIEPKRIGLAVMNRLKKAAGGRIVRVAC